MQSPGRLAFPGHQADDLDAAAPRGVDRAYHVTVDEVLRTLHEEDLARPLCEDRLDLSLELLRRYRCLVDEVRRARPDLEDDLVRRRVILLQLLLLDGRHLYFDALLQR